MNISVSHFADLLDVNTGNIPPSLTGDGLKIPQVNSGGNQIELVNPATIVSTAIGTGTAGDIPVFSASLPPIFTDSGVNIDGSQNVTGIHSIITPTLYLNNGSIKITHTLATSGASYPLIWPSSQGASGSVLTNDGSGNLSWVVPA